ncbi:MAG: hypothetical protein Tsb0014_18190 [Pleurocapsa sp.]
MNNEALVSIIINNYNYGHFLAKAINSALNQTYPYIEVIVVDDGSTDNSREIMASYGKKIIAVYKENGGQASAINAGFNISKGSIICLLDADDFFVDHKVKQIVKIMNQKSNLGWCFHKLKLVDSTGKILGTTRTLRNTSHENSFSGDFRLDMRKGKIRFYPPSTSGLCFTRSLLEKILPMPEIFTHTSADRYIRYAAIALDRGYFLNEELTWQCIHGNNAATLRQDLDNNNSREIIAAYCLRLKFPELAKFTNRMFARGLSFYWKNPNPTEYESIISQYFSSVSLPEKVIIFLIAIYRSLPWKKVYSHDLFEVTK